MRNYFKAMSALPIVLAASTAWAQDSQDQDIIYVTAARVPVSEAEATAALTRLDAADIEARGSLFAADILRAVPGLAVSKSGPAGSLTQIRARGSEANHVLVLIDGIEAGSPFTGGIDFAHFTLDGLAAIEVSRGEQSALWGADAIGGVIQFVSARPEDGRQARFTLEGGSLDTGYASASAGIGHERGWFTGGASRFISNGIDVSGQGGETDGYDNTALHGSAGWHLNEDWRLEASARLIDYTTQFDSDADFDGRLDDTDSETDGTLVFARAALLGEQGLGVVSLAHQLTFQLTDDESASFSNGAQSGRSIGQRQQAHYQATTRWGDDRFAHRLTGLIEFEENRLKSDSGPGAGSNQRRVIETNALAADYGLTAGSAAFNLSVRHEDNALFDNATTWRAGAGWSFDHIGGRVHLAAGEGVKNPDLFELYGFFPAFFVGNPDLEPERSQGWELGWTQTLDGGRGSAGIVYFQSELENEIFTDFGVFPATARNAATASERTGWEFEGRFDFTPALRALGSVSLLDSEQNGASEIRRPETLASLTLDWQIAPAWAGALTLDYTGEQTDTDFATFQDVTLDAYTLVGGQLRWEVREGMELYVRGENLFDEEYVDVVGYENPGRTAYLGLRIQRG